ncbi:MAG: prephenate dehydrogenase/arogenate dehydrogenase family protein [Acidobacteriota bacterium]
MSNPPVLPFERLAIVGFGLIGASIASAVRRRWPSALIIAIDRRDVIEAAIRTRAADGGGDDLGMAAQADLIVLAAPVRANLEIVSRLASSVPGEAIVTDVGSTKRETVTAAAALPPRLSFIGGHPLAGAAIGGIEAARADLFDGRPWILTPSAADEHAEPREKLASFLAALGARVHVMAPDAHDSLVAYLSHIPQLAATALMDLVGGHVGAEGLALAGRGLRDTTRLASSPADIWRDITASNPDQIARAIDELVAILLRLKPGNGTAAAALDSTFDSAAQWKRVLEREVESS